ncbi:hypothetical protein B0H13DRAFT_2441000 [Mycena leptocephala]|nr:hypothetical protein B0H13DRAFT_2441000 [Mycena leptocephala]
MSPCNREFLSVGMPKKAINPLVGHLANYATEGQTGGKMYPYLNIKCVTVLGALLPYSKTINDFDFSTFKFAYHDFAEGGSFWDPDAPIATLADFLVRDQDLSVGVPTGFVVVSEQRWQRACDALWAREGNFKSIAESKAEKANREPEIHSEVSTANARTELLAKRARMQKAYEARAQAAYRQNKGKAPVLDNGPQCPAITSGKLRIVNIAPRTGYVGQYCSAQELCLKSAKILNYFPGSGFTVLDGLCGDFNFETILFSRLATVSNSAMRSSWKSARALNVLNAYRTDEKYEVIQTPLHHDGGHGDRSHCNAPCLCQVPPIQGFKYQVITLPNMSRPQAHSPQALSSIATNSVGASLSGFKHSQNETITFNLKCAEDPEEDFAFVQGAVMWLHCRVQPFKTSPSPPHRPLRLMSLSNPQRWVDHPARAP